MSSVYDLRIHHFFDIIRDFGAGKDFKHHSYGHSLHKIALLIKKNPNLKLRLVVRCDEICKGCRHFIKGHCDDVMTRRKDFTLKEEFNNFIDNKILNACFLKEGNIVTPAELCKKAQFYLDNIFIIYEGNEKENTQSRKDNVIKGLKTYRHWHNE